MWSVCKQRPATSPQAICVVVESQSRAMMQALPVCFQWLPSDRRSFVALGRLASIINTATHMTELPSRHLSTILLLPQSLDRLFQELRHPRLRLMHVIHARAEFRRDRLSRTIEQHVLFEG